MRLSFSAALSAAVAALLVASVYAQVKGASDRDFTAAALTAAPAGSWPTNGGNLANQRFSPLTAINRNNVAQLKGVWRARLNGSGTAPQYSGFAAPIVYDGVAYISTGANDVFALSLDGGEILWQYQAKLDPNITSVCCGWNNKGVAISEDKVFIGQLDGKLVALLGPHLRELELQPQRHRHDRRVGGRLLLEPLRLVVVVFQIDDDHPRLLREQAERTRGLDLGFVHVRGAHRLAALHGGEHRLERRQLRLFLIAIGARLAQ